jgi:hypothetical protein
MLVGVPLEKRLPSYVATVQGGAKDSAKAGGGDGSSAATGSGDSASTAGAGKVNRAGDSYCYNCGKTDHWAYECPDLTAE